MKKSTFVPAYRRIYQSIREKILSGELAPGVRLPAERELIEQYGLKRVTVRHALELLSDEGLIEKRTGIGSFVRGASAAENAPAQTEGSQVILFVMRQNENDIRHNTTTCNTMLFFSMEQVCRRNGYLLSYVGMTPETDLGRIVREHPTAGVFLVSSFQEQAITALRGLEIPTVLLNHYDPNYLSVLPDNSLMEVIHCLKEKGHRHIAYINGMPEARNAQERWEAFRFAMHMNRLTVSEDDYYIGNWTFEGGRRAAQTIMTLPERPTAVFAASDMMAAGAIEGFKSAGLSVPGDISIIGYDNLEIDELLAPRLTSVAVDFARMSEIAFEHLIQLRGKKDRGESEPSNYTIRLPGKLVERDSVAEAKQPEKV